MLSYDFFKLGCVTTVSQYWKTGVRKLVGLGIFVFFLVSVLSILLLCSDFFSPSLQNACLFEGCFSLLKCLNALLGVKKLDLLEIYKVLYIKDEMTS